MVRPNVSQRPEDPGRSLLEILSSDEVEDLDPAELDELAYSPPEDSDGSDGEDGEVRTRMLAPLTVPAMMATFGSDAEEDMRELLTKWDRNELTSSESDRLRFKHQRNFARRVRQLNVDWFPGREKSTHSIESLGGGAYLAFQDERTHHRKSAFKYCLDEGLPPFGFLYYWRTSATIAYLRSTASPCLHLRLKVLRNVTLALRKFRAVGKQGHQCLWWFPDRPVPEESSDGQDVKSVPTISVAQKVPSVIAHILVHTGRPMTKAELNDAVLRALGVQQPEPESIDLVPEPTVAEDGERALLEGEVRARTLQFWNRLSDVEKDLLAVRRWGASNPRKVSWERVAQLMARIRETKSGEHWRNQEKPIIEGLKTQFDPSEGPVMVSVLTELVRRHPLPEPLGTPPSDPKGLPSTSWEASAQVRNRNTNEENELDSSKEEQEV